MQKPRHDESGERRERACIVNKSRIKVVIPSAVDCKFHSGQDGNGHHEAVSRQPKRSEMDEGHHAKGSS